MQRESGVLEIIVVSALIFRCSLAVPLASHVALGKVLTALNVVSIYTEINIFTWQRDCGNLIR